MLNRWHAEDREAVLHQLGTHPTRGLEPAESTRRLREHGPNVLRAPPADAPVPRLVRRLASPAVLLLLFAAAAAASAGWWASSLAIAAAALLDAALAAARGGPARGRHAGWAGLLAPSARVIRGGKPFRVPAAELVPGDLAELGDGDRVPADLRLVGAEGLVLDESELSGELFPVLKDAGAAVPETAPLGERPTMVFAGTIVRAGRGVGVVTATGMRTEIGRVAELLAQASPAPPALERRLDALGRGAALGGLGACALVFALRRLTGAPAAGLAVALAGLALAAIPAALAPVVTVGLAAGARRLARRGVRVRRPACAAAPGEVTVVAAGKADAVSLGALTVCELELEGERVEVGGEGYRPEGNFRLEGRPVDAGAWDTLRIAVRIAGACTQARIVPGAAGAWEAIGDPVEAALLALALKGGFRRDPLDPSQAVLARYPSGAERRRCTVVVPGRNGLPLALTAGAADVVLGRCLHQRTPAGVRPLGPADRERILRRGEEMAGRGLRVLGLAWREGATGEEAAKVERAMVWVGLAGMNDPPRPDAAAAVAECLAAGATPVIVTGERAIPALALARQVGVAGSRAEALSGEELDGISQEALSVGVERFRVFARAGPEHRLRIVRAWKRRGHRVAFIGERACDGPALREADLGLTVGQPTPGLAEESAAATVVGDPLASVAGALREGRAILEDLGRAIAFLLAGSMGAALVLSAGILANLPPPLLPLQVLWLHFVHGGLPAAALASGPGGGGAPRRGAGGPEGAGERGAIAVPAFQALVLAAAGLGAFLLAWRGGAGGAARARTLALAALGLAQVLGALASSRRSAAGRAGGPGPHPRLLAAAGLSALLLGAAVQIPAFGGILGTVPLGRWDWIAAGGLALASAAAGEVGVRWLARRAARSGD